MIWCNEYVINSKRHFPQLPAMSLKTWTEAYHGAKLLKRVPLKNNTELKLCYRIPVAHLSVECKDDKVCLQRDPNSHCLTLDERTQCACKSNYHLDITNRTAKCVYGESPEEYKEGLTAAPIILCFMGCVIVEAVCLLVFHYWKKHRTEFISHGTCHLQAVSLADVRFHIQDRGPVISFRITPEMESTNSDTRTSSPPPYSQTVISPNLSQSEEPPPPYDEAVKQCSEDPIKSCADKSNRRKMSC